MLSGLDLIDCNDGDICWVFFLQDKPAPTIVVDEEEDSDLFAGEVNKNKCIHLIITLKIYGNESFC